MIAWLDVDTPFPDVRHALKGSDTAPGLLAVGGDLSPQRLLDAYRHGIFPWFSEGQPILWWSTDPRMVLHTERFIVSDSLKKKLKKVHNSMCTDRQLEVRFDHAFEDVIRACAAPRNGTPGTWISKDIIAGYVALHRLGHAHSSEFWIDNCLVGGVYGVSIGRMFYGESMFARVSDASKIALAYLVHFLKSHDVSLIDCQQETAHLASLGAKSIPRQEFMQHLKRALDAPQIECWKPIALF